MLDFILGDNDMVDKNNKKIIEYKKIIKEQKKKIKLEKKAIKKKKRDNFRKSKFGKTTFGKMFGDIFFVFRDKSSYSFGEIFTSTIVSLALGFFACFSIITIIGGGRNYFKMVKDLGKFYDVYEVLIGNYNGDVDKEKLVDDAISGMVSSVGDVYTSYNDANVADAFDQMVSGTYEGIGCTIQQTEDGVKVIQIYEESPAEKAGLKENDIIKKVDELDAKEVGVTKLSDYIKNVAQGKIKMTILREKEELSLTLERGKVEVPSILSKTFEKNDKKIGYLGISIFSSVSAKQFDRELKKLEDKKIDSLVIDVRGNNGGYLSAVTDIASRLLPKGKVLYQVQKGNKKQITKDKTSEKREYPIAILVDGNSASASEILAGVIKESYEGYVVGMKTYGKGTVQQVKKLSDGSMIKYTVENWLTPDGNWINEKGIEPTDEVKLNDDYLKKPSDETDNQLQKALELVSK